MLEVYRIGSSVTIGKSIDATILEITIKSNNYVIYQCGWWNGNSYEMKWFEEFMVSGDKEEKRTIGFRC